MRVTEGTMSAPPRTLDERERPWTHDEFFAWLERKEDEVEIVDGRPIRVRYELVDGFPARMMAGASKPHDQVMINVLTSVDRQLDGKHPEEHTIVHYRGPSEGSRQAIARAVIGEILELSLA